ncbi:hypothetical protein H4R18_005152 [Coemansia javaensis]|uniref:Multiple inositol polyphosphate phosphatase 1 n=1 Tax=Coemansia javaensis TaxID=2761396 RepID=A0A9W8LF98_9FUNG|nr:hypothetical protein H4R18_005152 [Coemansia javaensis]
MPSTLEDLLTGARQTARRRRVLACMAGCALLLCALYVYLVRGGHHAHALALSTKAPYPRPDPAQGRLDRADMELVQVQFIMRHGARYPSESGMDAIGELYDLLRDRVPADWMDADLVAAEKTELLADRGRLETVELARRLAARYPEVLGADRAGLLQFISSEFQRTVATAEAFRGAVSTGALQPVVVVPAKDDAVLAMKFICPRWVALKPQAREQTQAEHAVFDAAYGQELRAAVARRLRVGADRLTVDTVRTIHELCGYEMSLYGRGDRWCTLLDERTAALAELRNDIEYTRVYGPYGDDINRHIACALVTDVARDVDAALSAPAGRAASVFRFGHSETIMFASALLRADRALGAAQPPVAGNMSYADSLRRGFRSTAISPFSANWGLEVYKDRRHARPFFRLLLNERPVRLPACPDALCPLSVLRSIISADVGCNYTQMCRSDT